MMTRIIAVILVSLILCSATVVFAESSVTSNEAATEADNSVESSNYDKYYSNYSKIPFIKEEIVLKANESSDYTGKKANTTISDHGGAFELNEQDTITWTLDMPSDGRFNMELLYYPLQSRGVDINFSIEIDGKIPFIEASNITLSRLWEDNGEIIQDNRGNDIRPEQVEKNMWLSRRLRDINGYSNDALVFYLSSGKHTITLRVLSGEFAIDKMSLCPEEQIPTYKEYISIADQSQINAINDEFVKIQAEETSYKSSSMIFPTSDFGNPTTEPADPSKVKLNTLGQGNWKYPGQWVSWVINAPKAGYYKISFKYRQDYLTGFSTARRMYINGKTPFKEAELIYFPFNENFEVKPISDLNGKPYLVYLNEGKNILTLEVVIGEIGEILKSTDDIVFKLNDIYRKIIMITGTIPDQLRDYYLDREIPEMVGVFKETAESLKENVAKLEKNTNKGSQAVFFSKVANQLDSFAKYPETVQKRLESFKGNVSSLAATVLSFKEQPLELDYIIASGEERELPSVKAGFFKTIIFRLKAFVASFFEDYNYVGNIYTDGDKSVKPLNVWANGETVGREQMAEIKRLIDNEFVKDTRVPVNLSLVAAGVLNQAILAGTGPDVAIFIPEAVPINLSMRDALVDVSKFKDFDEIKKDFFESAFIPYEYEGGIYGMPETQLFSMQFYRKDIFKELELNCPVTWDDFLETAIMLQKNKLQAGIPEDIQLFETLLLQNGGQVYNDNHTQTELDKPKAIDAFNEWTSFYRNYSFPINFDAYNRFRTGEMPLVIMPYSFYNMLLVAAPEIRNKWEMQPVPGKMADGKLVKTESASGTCSIMMSNTKQKENAFQFIKWWVSSDIQAKYGNAIEAQMGTAARYNTANINAFNQLKWSSSERDLLTKQWKDVWDIPVVPGDYYVGRNLANAFRRVVFYNQSPRETLNRYNEVINKEITRKRMEYGLSIH